MSLKLQSATRLTWQSQLVLLLAVPLGTAGIAVRCVAFWPTAPAVILQAIVLGALLALLTWRLRAATGAAAITGGLFATALYLDTPGLQTALWPLLALLLLTLAATRFGRARKETLGVAEGHQGRTATQVAANLGIAVLAGIPLGLSAALKLPRGMNGHASQLALAAALAEAAADTLSSELGEVLGGEPRLLTNFRRVPAGSDGAISLAGTLAGIAGAIIVTVVAAFSLDFALTQGIIVASAAIAGLFVDSLLGATLERRGFLNNDAVNFLSTLTSALLAAALCN
jgi:uncharacterized protein (TIGR00297 family)